MPLTNNKDESLVETQALLSQKEESTQLATVNHKQKETLDSSFYYQSYWSHFQRYLYHKDSSIDDLHHACQYLLMAVVTGKQSARFALKTLPEQVLSYELSRACDLEFMLRMQDFNLATQHFIESRNRLFTFYYYQRYQFIYKDYTQRFEDIYQAFFNLVYGQTNQSHNANRLAISFAEEMIEGFPDKVTTGSLVSGVWKVLALELVGEDPLFSLLQNYLPNVKESDRIGSYYPFRVLPPEELKAILSLTLENQPKFVEKLSNKYTHFIQKNITEVECKANSKNRYSLEISKEQLETNDKPIICFVDAITQLEIARFELIKGQIYFKGYGDSIHLKINGTLDYSSCIFENPGADLKLTADFNSEKPLYIATDACHLTCEGKINSSQNIKLETRGKLEISPESEVNALMQVELMSDALALNGKVISQSHCQLRVNKGIVIDRNGVCDGKLGVAISAGLLKSDSGRILSDSQVKIDSADGIFLNGAAEVHGKSGLIIKSESMMCDNKSSLKTDGTLQLKVNGTLIAEKETGWSADSYNIHAKKFKNYSPNLSANKAMIHCEATFTNYSTGVITTEKLLQFTGGSVWNGGKFKFGKSLRIKLNNIFVNGVSQISLNELKDSVINSSISGEEANIVAGAVFNALGKINVRTWSLSAIVEIGAALAATKYTRKSRLFSLDVGIDVPNLPIIYKDLAHFCNILEKGDYQSALDIICTWESLNNGISVGRWLARTLAPPGVGKSIDLIWSSLMLIASMPRLYNQCSNLYQINQRGGKVEYSDLYELIAIASGIGTQGLNIAGQVQTAMVEGMFSAAGTVNPGGDIPGLFASFISLGLPSTTDDAVVGLRYGGFHSNASMMHRTMFSSDIGSTQVGVNIANNFYRSSQQDGVTAGNNISNIGHHLDRSGTEIANNDYTNVYEQNDSSRIIVEKLIWQTEKLNENARINAESIHVEGTQTLDHHGDLNARNSTTLTGGIVSTHAGSHTAGNVVAMTGSVVNHEGTADSKSFVAAGIEQVNIKSNANINTEKADMRAKCVNFDGNMSILKNSDVDAISEASKLTPDVIIFAKKSAELDVNSSIQGQGSTVLVQADNVTMAGKSVEAVLMVNGGSHATLTSTARTEAEKVNVSATNVEQDSQIIINKNSNAAQPEEPKVTPSDIVKNEDGTVKPPSEKKLVVPDVSLVGEDKVNIGITSNIQGEQAVFLAQGKDIVDAGHATVKSAILNGTNETILTKDAVTDAEYFYAAANDVEQNSRINILRDPNRVNTTDKDKTSDPEIVLHGENHTVIGEESKIQAAGSTYYVQGNQIVDKGHAVAENVVFNGKEKVTLTEAAVTEASIISVKSKDIEQNSKIIINKDTASVPDADPKTINPDILFSGDNSVHFGEKSSIEGIKATLYTEANNVEVEGTIKTEKTYVKAHDELKATADITSQKIVLDSDNSLLNKSHMHVINATVPQPVSPDKQAEEKAVEPAVIIHGKDVNMTNESTIDAANQAVLVSAEALSDSCLSNVGTYMDQATASLDVTKSAHHEASEAVIYKAPTAHIQGSAKAKEVDVEVADFLEVQELMSRTGPYENIIATNLLFINTKQAIDLNQNFDLNFGVELEASSISIGNNNIHSSQNLAFKSDQGDIVTRHSNITADQLSFDSSGAFFNDHGVLSGNALFVRAQGDITNWAGTLQGNAYLQAISEHGSIFNIGELRDVDDHGHQIKIFDSARIIGGNGNGYDNVGLYLKAGDKLINQGSLISSASNGYIDALHGIDNTSVDYSYHKPFERSNNALDDFYRLRQYIIREKLGLNTEYKTQSAVIAGNGTVIIKSDQGDILNSHSLILGNELSLQASGGSIINLAGTLQALKYLEATAGYNIENRCVEHDVRGKYDVVKQYEVGLIAGGTGDGHDGVGLYFHAGNQVINDASEISSIGSNVISGDLGIRSIARYHTYKSFERHDKKWYGKETSTVDYSNQLQPAMIYSAKGSNTLISNAGAIYSCSTLFYSAHENNFSARDDIKLTGLVLKDKEFKEKSSLWGINDRKTTQIDEVAAPTVVVNPDNTNIVSLNGNVEIDNAYIHNNGELNIQAKDVTVSAPILNHSFTEESRSLGITSPAMSMANYVPLYEDYKALSGSQCGAERAANTWNASLDVVNSVNSSIAGIRAGSLMQTVFPTSNLASVDLSYTRTKTTSKYQTVASNVGIQCKFLNIKADNSVSFEDGVPILVECDANIQAKTFNQSGAELHSSMKTESESVTVGVSLQSDINVGASISKAGSHTTSFSNQIFQVGGKLNVTADQWNMSDANVVAGDFYAQTDSLSIISHANTTSSYSKSASANTNGSVSYQQASNESAMIGTPSGIRVEHELHLTTKQLNLEGAKILSNGDSHIIADVVTSKSVDEYNRGSSFGFSANVNDFLPSSGTQWKQALPTVGLSFGKQDYRATQQSTIWNAAGTGIQAGSVIGDLNTGNSNGLNVSRNDKYNVQVKVPMLSSSGLAQLEDNFEWAGKQLFPEKVTPLDEATLRFIEETQHKIGINIPDVNIDFNDPDVIDYEKTYLGNRACQGRKESQNSKKGGRDSQLSESEKNGYKQNSIFSGKDVEKSSTLENVHEGLGVGGVATGLGEYSGFSKTAEIFHALGKHLFTLDLIVEGDEIYQDIKNHQYSALEKPILDLAAGALGIFGGGIGFALSAGYTAIDTTIGWDKVTKKYNDVDEKFKKTTGIDILTALRFTL